MYGELAAVCTLGAGIFKVAEIATGEAQRKRDESMERAVEKHFNSIDESQDDMEES